MSTTTTARTFTQRDYRLVAELSGQGWRNLDVARLLDVPESSFYRYLDADPALRAALEEGRGKEHRALVNSLFTIATDTSNPGPAYNAARFLLKSRHGYREDDKTTDTGPKVAISITLPAALSPQQYRDLLASHPAGSLDQPPTIDVTPQLPADAGEGASNE